MSRLDQFRLTAKPYLLALVVLCLAATGVEAMLLSESSLGIAIAAVLIAGVAIAAWLGVERSQMSRIAFAIACQGQVAVMLAAFQGHPWQVDIHMMFFAMMAILIALIDARAIFAGAAAVAVHHLALNFALPALVYPGGSDLGRTILHAVVLIVSTAALAYTATFLTRIINEAEALGAAEAERATAATAAARLAEAALSDDRTETTRMIERSFGNVVAAGVAGDFSQRVDENLDDPTFARLARDVNALLRSIDTNLAETCRVIEAIAEGDLRARMIGDFSGRFASVQRSINGTATTLGRLVASIRDVSEEIERASDRILTESQALSAQTESQVASLVQTASTMEQLTATVGANAQTAAGAATDVAQSTAAAERGRDIAADAVKSMRGIEDQTRKISEIVSTVDGIAFQTNLLALNAAVEAARAGEAGKGFAVVAQEVRTLAQRAAAASGEISVLVGESDRQVSTGVSRVEATGKALEEIRAAVVAVNASIGEISAASAEQSAGLSEINGTISLLESETQRNAALAVGSTSAARALRGNADQLRDLIAFFKADAEAQGRAAA